MTSAQFLSASEAAGRLGVSAKALRLYEQRGLLDPIRTAAGWRTYGPDQMARAAEIAALRELGFSLAQVARVLNGDLKGLEPALAAHQGVLESRVRQLFGTIEKLHELKEALGRGKAPTAGELAHLASAPAELCVAFELPWPWGGERFELRQVRPLNYIVGPLGSGKTRLAQRLAETLPGATFAGLDRLTDGGAAARVLIDNDPVLGSRIDRALAWLVEDGATASPALLTLLAKLESKGSGPIVVDMIEQGLEQATQEALAAHLRRRGPAARPLFLLTRSSAILDLTAVTGDEAIILCPANHSSPMLVVPFMGAPGYEAVATCLASPQVRARTEGVIAWRPAVASAFGPSGEPARDNEALRS
ncbi:MAG TPA: MerR family transcriptional regulator [Devosiaceae bacterium]|nr:MerR family transcriptional regulator [Devosiaceae bacterium]